jgi:hypothetical protein
VWTAITPSRASARRASAARNATPVRRSLASLIANEHLRYFFLSLQTTTIAPSRRARYCQSLGCRFAVWSTPKSENCAEPFSSFCPVRVAAFAWTAQRPTRATARLATLARTAKSVRASFPQARNSLTHVERCCRGSFCLSADVDDCNTGSPPCLNGASCVDGVNAYTCK